MKVIDGEICIFNGKLEHSNLTCKEDLRLYKEVYNFDMQPPVLVYTKPDSQVYVVWEKSEINEFAQNHIYKYYPAWKQSNILRDNNSNEISKMGTFIDAVRAWSNSDNPDPWDGSLELIVPE